MKTIGNKVVYLISIIASLIFIISMLYSGEVDIVLMMGLLFFGGCGIFIYLLNKKGNKKIEDGKTLIIIYTRTKMIALMFMSLIFVVLGCFFLLFKDTHTVLDYIFGIAEILFFGSGFFASIIILIKPKILMKISNEGIFIPKGFGLINREFLFFAWEDIENIGRNKEFFSVYLKNPTIYPVNKIVSIINNKVAGTNINLPISSFNYNIDEVENFIKNKLSKYEKK